MPHIMIIISLGYQSTIMQEFSSRDTCMAAAEAMKVMYGATGRKMAIECVLK
jgi:hypothetical protein